MRTCDTLVIGSCYMALGLAVAGKDVLICEESENGDTRFYAPLRSFRAAPWVPATDAGQKLLAVFEALGLLKDGTWDLCGFETAFCRFALEREVALLLKCRVVELCPTEAGFSCRLLHNGGLETVLARRVIDTRCRGKSQSFSLLFEAGDPEGVKDLFPEGTVEPAFQKNRWALHIPVTGDYNASLEAVCRRWEAGGARLLCFGSRLAQLEAEGLGDEVYSGPVEAFEAGLSFAEREGL